MKDHSTMNTFEFLFSIAWKYVIGVIWYKNLLFRVLPHRDVEDSLHLLLNMMLVSTVCFMIVMRRRKNGWTVTACFVFPFSLYTIMTYATTSALLIKIVMITSVIVSLAYLRFYTKFIIVMNIDWRRSTIVLHLNIEIFDCSKMPHIILRK